jgi:integrase/recombinase XerC
MSDLIAGYVRHMKAAGMSRMTTTIDREGILRRIDNDLAMGLERATVEELADWLGRDGWSPKTRLTYYEAIRGFFSWACNPRNPVLDYDPSLSLARPKVYRGTPKPVSAEEMAAILAGLSGFWLVAALLASHEGARACEVAAIEREDITEDWVSFHGKGGKVAAVPTHELVWRAVRDFPGGSLAMTLLGRPVSRTYISSMFPRVVERYAGLKRINLHRLRHWFATTLLLDKDLGGAGADLRTVQELMRHSSPNLTMIYTQITDRQRKIAVSALPVLTPASS